MNICLQLKVTFARFIMKAANFITVCDLRRHYGTFIDGWGKIHCSVSGCEVCFKKIGISRNVPIYLFWITLKMLIDRPGLHKSGNTSIGLKWGFMPKTTFLIFIFHIEGFACSTILSYCNYCTG